MKRANPVKEPKLGQLSQGTIFTCARAEEYEDSQVFGLVITARCDVAHSKVPVLNYLPVVPLDKWIHRDGRAMLCDRALRQLAGKMKNILKNAGFSESILLTQTPADILAKLFPPPAPGRRSKDRDQFAQYVEGYESVLRCSCSKPDENLVIDVAGRFDGERNALIRELLTQRLNGYYFLPSAFPEEGQPGYVVLFREIHHLPRDLCTRIASGLSAEEYSAACTGRFDFSNRLSFVSDDFAMPVGTLSSPFIEHLMQSFSSTFARIGLPDLDDRYIDNIWSSQPSVEGAHT